MLVAVLWAPLLRAQPMQLEAGYERDVNRFRWTADLRLAQRMGPWDLSVANRFLSDAFILFENRVSFRDENHLSWSAGRPLGDRLALRLHGRMALYSLSRVLNQTAFAGVRVSPRPYAWFEPMVGMALDRRPGAVLAAGNAPLRADVGPAFGLRLGLTPPPVNGYRLQLDGDGAWHQITPRRGRVVRLRGRAERDFEGTLLRSEVRLSSFRRDAYQAVSFLNRNVPTGRLSETVEATTSDTLTAFLEVETPLYRALRLGGRLDLSANNRFIRTLRAPEDVLFFDSDFNRRTFDAEAGLNYDRPRLAWRLALRGGAEVERRRLANADGVPAPQAVQKNDLLQQADYDRGYLMLQARGRGTLARWLSFQFDGTASALRHDTPDVSPDDRDELFYNGLFGLRLQLSRYLNVDLQTFGTYYHTVYLKATRSAENNVQRSLRFRTAVQWTSGRRSRVRLSSEVRATYTVDDFVLPGRRPTDQSARELRYDLDTEHDFGNGLRLRAEGSFSDLRLGRFLNDVFAEIPFDTLQTYSGWVRLEAGRRVTAEIGLRFFIRSDFDRATTVRYERVDAEGNVLRDEEGRALLTSIARPGRERIEQVGPTTALTWPMRNGSALRLEGWFTVQHERQRLYGGLPEGSGDRIRAAGRRGRRTLIPNLAVTMLWNF